MKKSEKEDEKKHESGGTMEKACGAVRCNQAQDMGQGSKLKIGLALRNRILCEGLKSLVRNCKCYREIEVVLYPGNGHSFDAGSFDVLIADYYSLTVLSKDCFSASKIIVLDSGLEKETVTSLFLAENIVGFLDADADISMLCKAIKVVHGGEIWIDNHIIKSLLSKSITRQVKEKVKLTERELALTRLIREGYRNREIAAMLSISEQTVKSHVGRIFRKMNITSRSQLISRFAGNTNI